MVTQQNIGIVCLLNGGHGQYIPAMFIECYNPEQWGVTEQDQKELSSLENKYYWETWDSVEQYATFTDENGNKWHLYQDGDLFAICYELLTEDEKQFLGITD